MGFALCLCNTKAKLVIKQAVKHSTRIFARIKIWRLIDMAKRSKWLDVQRKKHGVIWWLLIGWWERPTATFLWYLLASIGGFKGVKFHYYK